MQIGFNLPVSGPMAAPEVMAEVAQLGESLGFAYLTTTDHIALPDTSTPGYPYSESGAFSCQICCTYFNSRSWPRKIWFWLSQ